MSSIPIFCWPGEQQVPVTALGKWGMLSTCRIDIVATDAQTTHRVFPSHSGTVAAVAVVDALVGQQASRDTTPLRIDVWYGAGGGGGGVRARVQVATIHTNDVIGGHRIQRYRSTALATNTARQ
jgi:hypothetical protein